MAQTRATSINTLLHLSIFLLFPHQLVNAESTAIAPSPSSTPWPIDIIAILKKGLEFSIFIKFLDANNNWAHQINTLLITSDSGITVLAPTDAAFGNLPSGSLNKFSNQQKLQLVQYHVLPKFYSLDDLETASNPVTTQATGSDGLNFWLNFTGHNNQVNVTSGVVETQVSNTLTKKFPLAVYQIDKVLLPLEFTSKGARPKTKGGKPNNSTAAAAAPKEPSVANEPSPANEPNSAGRMSRLGIGLGLAPAVGMFCMGIL